jgi:hypothetical protein
MLKASCHVERCEGWLPGRLTPARASLASALKTTVQRPGWYPAKDDRDLQAPEEPSVCKMRPVVRASDTKWFSRVPSQRSGGSERTDVGFVEDRSETAYTYDPESLGVARLPGNEWVVDPTSRPRPGPMLTRPSSPEGGNSKPVSNDPIAVQVLYHGVCVCCSLAGTPAPELKPEGVQELKSESRSQIFPDHFDSIPASTSCGDGDGDLEHDRELGPKIRLGSKIRSDSDYPIRIIAIDYDYPTSHFLPPTSYFLGFTNY